MVDTLNQTKLERIGDNLNNNTKNIPDNEVINHNKRNLLQTEIGNEKYCPNSPHSQNSESNQSTCNSSLHHAKLNVNPIEQLS